MHLAENLDVGVAAVSVRRRGCPRNGEVQPVSDVSRSVGRAQPGRRIGTRPRTPTPARSEFFRFGRPGSIGFAKRECLPAMSQWGAPYRVRGRVVKPSGTPIPWINACLTCCSGCILFLKRGNSYFFIFDNSGCGCLDRVVRLAVAGVAGRRSAGEMWRNYGEVVATGGGVGVDRKNASTPPKAAPARGRNAGKAAFATNAAADRRGRRGELRRAANRSLRQDCDPACCFFGDSGESEAARGKTPGQYP